MMTSLIRKVTWWLQRRRKEAELREELQFHLAEEFGEGRADGLPEDEARWRARRDLGNLTILREDARTVWSWVLLEQLAQDVRYGLRAMRRNTLFTALAALSLALGIGANTAIYSFMDAILLRALPVSDPGSLVTMQWQSRLPNPAASDQFVMHSIDGSTYDDRSGVTAAIFPFPAFEHLQEASAVVLSSLFAHKKAGGVTVRIQGQAELAQGEYVSGDFFRGLAVSPAAGRLIVADDDRIGAAPVAVVSRGYCESHFGDAASATGQQILINNVPFTVIGVTPSGFFGVDPAAAPQVYLPMHASLRLRFDPGAGRAYSDPNYYWVEMMGRLRPGVALGQAQAALAAPFAHWVATSATNDGERANLPVLRLTDGAGGIDSLRRQYAKPLYLLLAMVGLILAIACANTANLLLARAAARRREMAVRLSLGAGRWRVVRQLLTESVLLASLSGALGILMAVVGIRLLTSLLANGQEGFSLHAELNWHVLLVTLALSLLCGVLFGLAPALQSTGPALMPMLRDRSGSEPRGRVRDRVPRLNLTQALVVAQMAISLFLLVAAGLFVQTLSNLQAISLGFNRERVLLFQLNAPQAGYPESRVAALYADLRRRFGDVPGVRDATLSHASLIRAGRSFPITVDGVSARGTRLLFTGPRFFATMQIPLLRGRDIAEGDRQGTPPVVVVSDLFARAHLGETNPIGRQIEVRVGDVPLLFQIVGVAADVKYGGLKRQIPPVVYLPYAQLPSPQLQDMTYALRTEGDPLHYVPTIRQIVHQADDRVPLTNIRTQDADIDRTINQEIVFARLCSAFAILALMIASVGLYATMAYAVARRTNEIGLRMALGAERGAVIWMILREVCVLAAIGLTIGVPTALAASRLTQSFLFEIKPGDPRALAVAMAILLSAAVAAGYGPARRASRVDPMIALRHE
jgi:macrolide transport system ATP-binding/permease protein